jgi:hypothetical protein
VCHEKVKWMLGFASRCLFGRLARAMTTNMLYDHMHELASAYSRIS